MKLRCNVVVICMAMLFVCTANIEAQGRKRVWDAVKKVWVWVEENGSKIKPRRHQVRPHTISVTCDRCSGYGRIQVTVPVNVWNPYYQCYQTQYQNQIQTCGRCWGNGKIQKTVYY